MPIKQSGSNYKGLCPFHGEKTPSFHISSSKQIYKCFGCGEGGDVINFVMKMENLDFIDAVKLLANKCGIEINTNMNEEDKLRMEKSKKYQDIHLEAARFYFANLLKGKNPGYDYLRKRGLSDKIIKRFGLGYSLYSWNSLMDYLLSIGYEKKDLVKSGLVTHKENGDKYYDKFRNRVMFPIFDYRGNVIGFGGRVLDDSMPKYLNSPDTILFNKRYNLYGLNYAKKSIKNDTLILVEGYMDLISLVEYGIEIVVATLGTALKNDITRYELQKETLKLQLAKVQDTRKIMNHQLVTTLHLPAGTEIVPDSTLLNEEVTALAENDWQMMASQSNVGLQQAQLAMKMNEQKVKLERSELLPKIALVAGEHLDGPITIEVPVLDNNFNYWYVGVGIKYNLSSLFKNNKKVRQAKLNVRRAQEEYSLAQEQIENGVQANYVNFLTSFTDLRTQEKSVELADQNYNVTSNRYKNDLALLTDMLDASNMKLSADLGLVNARINLIYSYYKMKYITHTL